jgi:type VI protein secretion system component VasF
MQQPQADDAPRRLTPEEQAMYNETVAKMRRLVISWTIAKIGILALVAAVLWRFFGDGRN